MSLSAEDREEITNLIKVVVNGNIKRVEEKVDRNAEQHLILIERLNPIVEAVMWINTTRKALLWIASIAVSIASTLSLYNLLK